MRQLSRLGATAAAMVTTALLAGCGGSVADADADRAPVTRRADPPSPFCLAARANADAIRPLNTMAGGGTRPENLVGAVQQVRSTGAELVRLAPDEIRQDVELTVRAVNLQLDVLVANGGDAGAVARDPELMARLSSPELAGAGERYRSYVTRTCSGSASSRGNG